MPNHFDTHEACCKITTIPCPCPVCGNTGRKVTALTLDSHIPDSLKGGFGNEASFCSNPTCHVVYCNPAGKIIRRDETVLPVTVKDTGDDVHVCYCFDFKRSDIRMDLQANGTTTIPDKIKTEVREGRCDCERKNPQGACCLGNVAKVVKAIRAELELQGD